MHRGYVKLWRKLRNNPLWLAEPFTKGQAWVDLLMMANHKNGTVVIRGIIVEVNSGQVLAGEQYLADRWKWSRGRVRRFMSYLERKTVQQIVQQKNNVCTVITITNWKDYQGNGTADGTTSSTTDEQQTDTLKNVKNNKKEYTTDFEEFWKLYPNKKSGKSAAFNKYMVAMRKTDSITIMDSLRKHIELRDWTKDNGQYVPMATTWLNQSRWEAEFGSIPDHPQGSEEA